LGDPYPDAIQGIKQKNPKPRGGAGSGGSEGRGGKGQISGLIARIDAGVKELACDRGAWREKAKERGWTEGEEAGGGQRRRMHNENPSPAQC